MRVDISYKPTAEGLRMAVEFFKDNLSVSMDGIVTRAAVFDAYLSGKLVVDLRFENCTLMADIRANNDCKAIENLLTDDPSEGGSAS